MRTILIVVGDFRECLLRLAEASKEAELKFRESIAEMFRTLPLETLPGAPEAANPKPPRTTGGQQRQRAPTRRARQHTEKAGGR